MYRATMSYEGDNEFIFVGFDCAYRTLGWTILGYNPHADQLRNVYRFCAGSVIDLLNGTTIAENNIQQRARALCSALDNICTHPELRDMSRVIVIVEEQPRGKGMGSNNYVIEAQIVYHFSRIGVRCILPIRPSLKNRLAQLILREDKVRTYAERKKQSRRAFVLLMTHFNFDAAPSRNYKHIRADLADSCVQICAAIRFCAHDIDNG